MTFRQPYMMAIPISADGLDQADLQHLLHEYPGILWTSLISLFEIIELNSFITKEIELDSFITKSVELDSPITKEIELDSKIDFYRA